jgi:hypothetical protein
MKKSLQLLLAAFCFAIMLFCISEPVTAAPAINKDAQRPKATVNKAQNRPIAECYQNKGEVWPPAPGRYERKNPNGLCNAYLNVTVLPDQWPVINLHACEYNGPNDEHGWEALDTNPGIWLGGSMQPAQMGLAVRFIIGAKTIGMYRGNGILEALPNQKVFLHNSGVKSLKDRIIIDYPGNKAEGLPDIRGEYVLNKMAQGTNDEYAAYALIENLHQSETKTDFFDKNLQIKPQAITGSEAAFYKNLIGDSGFAVKVFRNGAPIRTFIVPQDLSAVYRFESDGNGVMIYNIDGTKG